MLQSMTGYGRSEFIVGDFTCILELRSLNGKQLEIAAKIPPLLKLYEIELRTIIQQHLIRGSVDVSIYLKQHGVAKPMAVNLELARYYYDSMKQIAAELQLAEQDVLPTLMRMPEIVSATTESIQENDWKRIAEELVAACQQLNAHRRKEGEMLSETIRNNIARIEALCSEVDPYDKKRIERIRERLLSSVTEQLQGTPVDANRMEQEIIFYVEKLDINEEKNRLLHHCAYFHQMLQEEQATKGKKLGFLLQEIGREINTMGSKANDVDIQRIVVNMKDELEQAKEQLLNAL